MEKSDQSFISNGKTGISLFDHEIHYILPCWTNDILYRLICNHFIYITPKCANKNEIPRTATVTSHFSEMLKNVIS